MSDLRKLTAAGLTAAILLGVCLAWLLTVEKTDIIALQRDVGGKVPAGSIADGVRLEQVITIPEGLDADLLHLGLQFATYDRINLGKIRIAVEQGDFQREHLVTSCNLKDNTTAYFSFPGLDAGAVTLTLEGLDGPNHKSATVWCRYSSELTPMDINGEPSDRRMDVWFAYQSTSWEVIARRVGMGGFVFLTCLSLGVLTLLFYRGSVQWAPVDLSSETKPMLAFGFLSKRRLLLSIPVSLLVFGLSSWILFIADEAPAHYLPVAGSYSNERVHGPPLSKNTVFEQVFEITEEMAAGPIGLGITFGTFVRKNSAKIEIRVSQGEKTERVILKSGILEDNMERIFAFDRFDAGEARLTITGIDGKDSNSPTLWFVPSEETPQAVINGDTMPQQLLLFRYKRIAAEGACANARPASAFTWPAILAILVIVLFQIRKRK